MDPDDSKIMALAWIENLDEHHIPYRHYEELYRRSIGLRAQRLNEGLECDDFSVDMLIACWPGLSHEIQRRDIEAGRTLPDTAASDCPRCFGVGMETLPDPDNPRYRTARLCDHACPQGNQAAVGLTLERDPNQRRVMVQCESCEELHEIDLSRCNNGGEGR